MGNEGTKKQLKKFFDKAYEEAKNPDERAILKKKRNKRKKKVEKNFGL